MSAYETAQRVTAWTWAAETLGVEVTPERVANLVEVTRDVRLDNLRPALEAVIGSEVAGFLPSPGAVKAAARRIAERKASSTPRLPAGDGMGPEARKRWDEEHNPQGWTAAQWGAFTARLASDAGYRARCEELRRKRHAWAEERTRAELAGRNVSRRLALEVRRDYNREATLEFPNPDPLEGWRPPAGSTGIAAVVAELAGGAR